MHILLGVTAGISAYKIPLLVRLLLKQNHEVKVIMTPDAVAFVSPLVLATLSKNEVGIEFWDKTTGIWKNHVAYAEWADVMVIAPCTANTLAKLAHGACDNLLLATYFSMRKRTIIAPAMDLEMYQHPTVKRNLACVESDGVRVIPPEYGELASGMVGEGRLPEPESLAQHIEVFLSESHVLIGKKALVTAGPTYESIDAVRFIGNRSSGKMGFALADALAQHGAEVTLLSGPTHQVPKHNKVQWVKIETAEEMYTQTQEHWPNSDLGIFAAAVADYRPKTVSDEKIKKTEANLILALEKTPDSLAWAGVHKTNGQFLMGFALETHNGEQYAKDKIVRKNLDAVALNELGEFGVGFNTDTNKVCIFGKDGREVALDLNTKDNIAQGIVAYIIDNI